MRQLLLFIFFLGIISLNISAQDFQLFTADNVEISNNSIIQVYGDPSSEVIESILWIKNNSTNYCSLKVKKEIVRKLDGTENTFYWDTFNNFDIIESPTSVVIEPFHTHKGFIADYVPNYTEGIMSVKYTFFDAESPNIYVAVTIDFITDESANLVDQPLFTLSDAYPNPAKSVVYFDYAISRDVMNAKIIIRTLLGSVIAERNIESPQGKTNIDIGEFVEGIYFYSLVLDSEIKLTRKLIVKH